MIRIELEDEPIDDAYVALVRFAARRCNRALLVVRRSLPLASSGRAFLKASEPHLDLKFQSSEWPGTVLISEEADVYRYDLSPIFVLELTGAVQGLFQWQQPERPEDLCLIRPDGRPFLTSVAHERDGWLDVDLEEQAEVLQIPGLRFRVDEGRK